MEGNALQGLRPGLSGDGPLHRTDLPLTGQEDQNRLMGLPIRQPPPFQGPHHLTLQGLCGTRWLMNDSHRMGAPQGGENSGSVQRGGEGLQIQGG